jgi:hypothetical protein
MRPRSCFGISEWMMPARGHPLCAPGLQTALVAEHVPVLHRAVDHVRDGLEAAVRVLREAGEVVVGVVRLELVEQQERVEHRERPLPKGAVEADTGAIAGRLRREHL